MENQVIRDPAIKNQDSYRVVFNDRMCSPNFNSKGAADAYLNMLKEGRRKPEYSAVVNARSPRDVARAKARAPLPSTAEQPWNPRTQQGVRPSSNKK